MYKLIRKLFFSFDAERAHYLAMNALKIICFPGFMRTLVKRAYWPKVNWKPVSQIHADFFGLKFRNVIGLGAGFDKNAKYLRELDALGFGFVEIGTVTPRPQSGNDKPRLFRLPADRALINRMGFNNDGVDVIAKRLKHWRSKNARNSDPRSRNLTMIIGGNIGKNKSTPNGEAWKDYEICFRALHPFVDFFVVNVSSPNTPGLRELQDKEALRQILVNLQQQSRALVRPMPVLLKIAPDLTSTQLDDVIDLAIDIRLDGIVATNTTTSRENLLTGKNEIDSIGSGGLSGKPLQHLSTEVLAYLADRLQGKVPIIASGGIFTGMDARETFEKGASLAEVWTGFIYEGPGIVKQINNYLNH